MKRYGNREDYQADLGPDPDLAARSRERMKKAATAPTDPRRPRMNPAEAEAQFTTMKRRLAEAREEHEEEQKRIAEERWRRLIG